MPNIGPTEIVILLVVVVAVFGAKRLPELGSSLGKGIRGFGKGLKGDKDDEPPHLEAEAETEAVPPPARESTRV